MKKEENSDTSKKTESYKNKDDNSGSKKWFQGLSNPKTWNPSDQYSRRKPEVTA